MLPGHSVEFAQPKTHLSVVLDSKVEGEPGNPLCFCPRGDLQALYDTWETLVLETGVFSFRVLSDNGKVDVFVSGGEAGKRLADNDGSVNVEGLTHSDVPRVVAVLVDGGV